MPWQVGEFPDPEDAGKVVTAIQVSETGMPLWIPDDDEKASPIEVDWPKALDTISRLNQESKDKREAAESLAAEREELANQIKAFDGVDPKKAREALKKLESIDQGKLLDAEKVESFKASILQAAKDERDALVNERDTVINDLKGKLEDSLSKVDNLVISNAFANSDFVKKLQVPVEMVKMYFKKNFKIESDDLVGYDAKGNKINSRKTPGETAPFDEAMQIIVDQYPEKDRLFPGTAGGSGAGGGSGRTKVTGEDVKNMSLAEYERAKKEGRIAS